MDINSYDDFKVLKITTFKTTFWLNDCYIKMQSLYVYPVPQKNYKMKIIKLPQIFNFAHALIP